MKHFLMLQKGENSGGGGQQPTPGLAGKRVRQPAAVKGGTMPKGLPVPAQDPSRDPMAPDGPTKFTAATGEPVRRSPDYQAWLERTLEHELQAHYGMWTSRREKSKHHAEPRLTVPMLAETLAGCSDCHPDFKGAQGVQRARDVFQTLETMKGNGKAVSHGHPLRWYSPMQVKKSLEDPTGHERFTILEKGGGGPFLGPRGGKWADAAHTIPWKPEGPARAPARKPVENHHRDLFDMFEPEPEKAKAAELPRATMADMGPSGYNDVVGFSLHASDLEKQAAALPQDREYAVIEQSAGFILASRLKAPQATKNAVGGSTQVFLPSKEGTGLQGLDAEWVVIEAGDAIASHNPETFSQRSDYPEGVQERRYHEIKPEQLKVDRIARKLEPAFVANTTPGAIDGAPIITEHGVVLGGNGRTMGMQRAYKLYPETGAKLKDYLVKQAAQFGIESSHIAGMKEPILVRRVRAGKDPKELTALGRWMNEALTQGLDPRSEEVAISKRVTPELVGNLTHYMEADQTLGDFLTRGASLPFVKAIEGAAIIDQFNRAKFVSQETGLLNPDGRARVMRVLAARLLPDASTLDSMDQSLRNNLAQAVPFFLHAEQNGWDLREPLMAAVKADVEMSNRSYKRNEQGRKSYRAQVTMPGTEASEVEGVREGVAAAMLEVVQDHNGPRKLQNLLKRFALESDRQAHDHGGQGAMFARPKVSEEDALRQAMKPAQTSLLAASLGEGFTLLKALVSDADHYYAMHAIQWEAKRIMSAACHVAAVAGGSPDIGRALPRLQAFIEDQRATDARFSGAFSAQPLSREQLHGMLSALAAAKGFTVSEPMAKAMFTGPRGGKWADPAHTIPYQEGVENPAKGKSFEVPIHPKMFPHVDKEPSKFHILDEKHEGGKHQVQVSQHGGGGSTWMPKESVKHFVSDLSGKVSHKLKTAAHPDVRALADGKGEFLGKGDDGVAFKVGDNVVKMSSTVPYQPMNPGHRTPEQAANMLKEQTANAKRLKQLGVPGIQQSEYTEHEGKGFQVKPHVEIPEKFTKEQLDQVQEAVLSMHAAGWAMNDQIQPGLDSKGNATLFDVGKAAPLSGSDFTQKGDKQDDLGHLKQLYSASGVEFERTREASPAEQWDDMQAKGKLVLAVKKQGPDAVRKQLDDLHATMAREATDDLDREILRGDYEDTKKLIDKLSQVRKAGMNHFILEKPDPQAFFLTLGEGDLAKAQAHQYLRRFRGPSGKWIYTYADDAGAHGKGISYAEAETNVASTSKAAPEPVKNEGVTKTVAQPWHAPGTPLKRRWVDKAPGQPMGFANPKGDDGGTLAKYGGDPKTGKVSDPERAKLHDSIVDKFHASVKPVPAGEQKHAVVMMGGPASGKSTATRHMDLDNFVKVDPDAVKDRLPEMQEGISLGKDKDGTIISSKSTAAAVHAESNIVAKRIRARAVEEGKHVLVDGTGKDGDKHEKLINHLKEKGYHVHLVMAHQTAEMAHKLNKGRSTTEGRFVPKEVVDGAYAKIPHNFERLAKQAHEATMFDASRGYPPKKVWSMGEGGKNEHHDPEFVKGFKSQYGADTAK